MARAPLDLQTLCSAAVLRMNIPIENHRHAAIRRVYRYASMYHEMTSMKRSIKRGNLDIWYLAKSINGAHFTILALCRSQNEFFMNRKVLCLYHG